MVSTLKGSFPVDFRQLAHWEVSRLPSRFFGNSNSSGSIFNWTARAPKLLGGLVDGWGQVLARCMD